MIFMDNYERIWNLSKARFLQSVASCWIFNNKIVELLFFVGIAILIYCDIYTFDNFKYFKYVGVLLVLFSWGVIRYRIRRYAGYFEGYEHGFIDAATYNLGYDTIGQDIAINTALDKIDINKQNISEEDKISISQDIKEGYSKLCGFILTWRKI
jgi:hypothetical protein